MDNQANLKDVESAEKRDSTETTTNISSGESSVRRKHESKLQDTPQNCQTNIGLTKENLSDSKKKKKKSKYKTTSSEPINFSVIDSPSSNRTPKKYSASNTSDLPDDASDKINSIGNMRKQNKRDKDLPNNEKPQCNNERRPDMAYKCVNGQHSKAAATPISKGSPRTPNYTDSPRNTNYAGSPRAPNYAGSPRTPNYAGSAKKSNSSFAKKSFKFEPYIPLFEVQQGLKRGEFIEGALRINPRSYEDAYVNAPDGKMDIYIGGMQERNRALNGDIVVVQVNPKQEWKILCEAIKDHQERSGENIVKTVCAPIASSAPCKIHTPDKFSQIPPEASSSWKAFDDERKPDTLEILGVDKLVTDFNELSTKDRPNKLDKDGKEKGRRKKRQDKKRSASQEGSVDSLDDSHNSSPLQNCDPHVFDGNVSHNSSKQNDLQAFNSECSGLPINHHCDINNQTDNKKVLEPETNKNGVSNWNQWDATDIIIISPEQLLNVEDCLLTEKDNLVGSDGLDDDNVGNAVPPDALSGEEFTDSASVTSTHSHCHDQIVEDASFLVDQQDSENNNTNFNNLNDERNRNEPIDELSGEVILSSSLPKWSQTKDYNCKIQNRIPLTTIEVATESEGYSALVTRIDSAENQSSSDENVTLFPVTEGSATPAVSNHESVTQENFTAQDRKKPRKRKRKPKHEKSLAAVTESANVGLSIDTVLAIYQLTIDDVLKHPMWPKFVQKTGKVVHILQKKHSRLAAGHIKLCQDKNPQWALFSPNDSRIPRIMIPMLDCPTNFYQRPQDFKNVLFLAEITHWSDVSVFAAGRLIRNLGNDGDIECETEGILLENGVVYSDFPIDVVNCLPDSETWTIPNEELNKRKDFRSHCVFTIDPATARDMDDAVSCKILDNGNFEVGVHIADVTYFVHEDTPLDTFAKNRATSVYLVQKVVPMLPRTLCDNLCSLNPGKDRLTFSVVWEMGITGEIFNVWFGRTVINSCIKMSYEHAQDMIENPDRLWTSDEHPQIHGGFTIKQINQQVNQLQCLAQELRQSRFLDGALRLDQAKLQFTINPETNLPSGYNVFVHKESNKLIEEFMLLANMSVAEKLYNSFPELALLRRHPPPQYKPMEDIVTTCAAMGIHLDASSSGALQSSIASYAGDDSLSEARTLLLTNLCSKPMNCALYFCTGILKDPEMFHHYALNVPLYTHFTSPIRRYPDVVVHRLLAAALQYTQVPNMDSTQIEHCSVHCNDKKYNAKRVSELSAELFLAAFIRQCGTVNAKAIVTCVMDHSFDCLVLQMGIIKRVYCDKLPLVDRKYQRINGIAMLTLTWLDAAKGKRIPQTLVMFSMVDVTLTVMKEHLKINVTMNIPSEQEGHLEETLAQGYQAC